MTEKQTKYRLFYSLFIYFMKKFKNKLDNRNLKKS